MSLVESRWQRTVTFSGLYVAQGIPWGFMLITLPSHLAYEYPIDDVEIGRLKAIILVPWSLKLIWAPLIDSFTIRSMGRRRPWILLAELLMAVTLLGFLHIGNPSENLQYILAMYFVHNCFASLQDVCTDALAVDVIPFAEQGRMNALMWGSKLVGKGVGAWGLAHVLRAGGIEACVAVQIALLLGIMLIPLLVVERPGERRFPWDASDLPAVPNVRSPAVVVREFLRAFSLTTLFVYVGFTLAKLIGVGINEVATNTLYTQRLEPRWTDVDFSTAAGLYATGPIIVGSFLGGILADRFGRRPILIAGYGGFGLAAMTFAALPGLWNERWFAFGYLIVCETFGAIGSVGFISMAMRISWTTAAATVFTTYMTLSNVSHAAGQWAAGPVRALLRLGDSPAAELASYNRTFWLVGLASIAPLLLLPWVRPEEVDRAKDATGA